jgi:hypothetical protein
MEIIKTKVLDALADLVRARVALRGGRAREAMSMGQAQHLMTEGHDAVEEAIKTLREIIGAYATPGAH